MSLEQERTLKNIIECKQVSKSFPSEEGMVEIVKELGLCVKENEFLVLLGPGQCGKTTIINMIAGLEKVSEGTIIVNDKQVKGPDPERGVVFQTTALFNWLTTMGNVEYGPKMAGVPKKARREKAQYYINLVGLNGFEKTFPSKLSGGMQQRVGIARAYCNKPRVMMMDEPFGALDAQTRYLMQEELQRIWETERRTIVFVTNNIEEAVYLADRIIVLSNCPATIRKEFVIDLPRPRDYVSPKFLKLRKEITNVMDSTL